MLILGHRGKPRQSPENTLDSISRCVEDPKINGVEFDVWQTLDGRLVVIHDKELSRTTNGMGWVTQKNWNEIRRYRCKLDEQLTNEAVPELHEVLELLKKRHDFTADIEIKADPEAGDTQTSQVVQSIAEALKTCMADQIIVSSFDHRLPLKLRGLMPAIQIGFLQAGIPTAEALAACVKENRFDWCCLHYSSISKSVVTAAQGLGARVLAWTPDKPEEWERLHQAGVDAICTNLPDECVQHFTNIVQALLQQ